MAAATAMVYRPPVENPTTSQRKKKEPKKKESRGLWKLSLMWKSAQNADSHMSLEKSSRQRSTFPQLPQARRRLKNKQYKKREPEEGLWKLPPLWKSAQDADSHSGLEKPRTQREAFPQFPQTRRLKPKTNNRKAADPP